MSGKWVTGRIYKLSVDELSVIDGFNSRDFSDDSSKAHIEWLTESIKENGLQTPLKAKANGDTLQLIDGESRLRAVKLLADSGVDIKVQVLIINPKDDVEQLIAQGLSNTAKEFTPIEWAVLYGKLRDLGLNGREIASKFNVSSATVSNRLALIDAPEEIKEAVENGSISADNAIKVMREHKEDASKVVKEATKNGKASAKTINDASTTESKPNLKKTIRQLLKENVAEYHEDHVLVEIPLEIHELLIELTR